jgi:hypothetical protein
MGIQLYGLFKQASQDPPIESSDKPGMFDLKVKSDTLYSRALCFKGEHITNTYLPQTGQGQEKRMAKVG